jgi:hypothetical protein
MRTAPVLVGVLGALGGLGLGGLVLAGVQAAWPIRLRVRASLEDEVRREVRGLPPIDAHQEVRLEWRAEVGGYEGVLKSASDLPESEPASEEGSKP